MQSKFASAILLVGVLGIVAIALLVLDAPIRSPASQAQIPTPTPAEPIFEYDVLSGVGSASTNPMDLTMTSGWHYSRRIPGMGAIDVAVVRYMKGRGETALARFMEERGLSYAVGAPASQPTASVRHSLAA